MSETTTADESSGTTEADDSTDLTEPFTVTASGPVEYRRHDFAAEGVEEVLDITVEIERELDTVEAFGRFYDVRETTSYLHNAIKLLVEDCPGHNVYDEHLDDWSFEIDGPVGAYYAVGDAMSSQNSPSVWRRKNVADNCTKSGLFGPGATIALLAARRDLGKDVDFGWAAERFGSER